MADTIYELTLRHVVFESLSLVFGFVLCCIGAYFINRARVNYFDGKELSRSKIKTLTAVFLAMFLVTTLWAYRSISQEAEYIGKLGHDIALETQKGVLKSLHDYSKDWDLTKFRVDEKTFYFRREEIKNTDFNLDQNKIDEFEGKLVEIVYAEDSRIISFKVINQERKEGK